MTEVTLDTVDTVDTVERVGGELQLTNGYVIVEICKREDFFGEGGGIDLEGTEYGIVMMVDGSEYQAFSEGDPLLYWAWDYEQNTFMTGTTKCRLIKADDVIAVLEETYSGV